MVTKLSTTNQLGGLEKIPDFLEDALYGVAQMIGSSETVNSIFNSIKEAFPQLGRVPTKSVTDLVSYVMRTLSGDYQRLQKVLNYIDSKLASLPGVNSQVVKDIIRTKRSELLNSRNKVAPTLTKVESTMNNALSNASMQQMLSPSIRVENQKAIEEAVTAAKNTVNNTDLDSIERTMK